MYIVYHPPPHSRLTYDKLHGRAWYVYVEKYVTCDGHNYYKTFLLALMDRFNRQKLLVLAVHW